MFHVMFKKRGRVEVQLHQDLASIVPPTAQMADHGNGVFVASWGAVLMVAVPLGHPETSVYEGAMEFMP